MGWVPGVPDEGFVRSPTGVERAVSLPVLLGFSPAGDYQQHHHTQYDLHQDVAEVWAVGRQQSQHRVRPGVLLGAAADKGSEVPRPDAVSPGPWVRRA